MNRKSIALLYVDEYGGWLLSSFIISLSVIFISLLFSSRNVVFSSFLTFCFTLTAVNYYLFDHHVEVNINVLLPKIRKLTAFIVAFCLIIFYVFYNLDDSISIQVNDHLPLISIGVVGIVFGLAICLVAPLIHKQANEIKVRRIRDNQDKQTDKFDTFKRTLEGE